MDEGALATCMWGDVCEWERNVLFRGNGSCKRPFLRKSRIRLWWYIYRQAIWLMFTELGYKEGGEGCGLGRWGKCLLLGSLSCSLCGDMAGYTNGGMCVHVEVWQDIQIWGWIQRTRSKVIALGIKD